MRQIDACERCERHDISMPAPSAQPTAALIGDTCDTTTTDAVARPLGEVDARRADPQRRASASDSPPSGSNSGSSRQRRHDLGRHVAGRHALVHAVGQLDPPLVDRRTARRTPRPSAGPAAAGWRSARRPGPTRSATALAWRWPTSSSGSSMRPCSRPVALSAVRPWRTRISTTVKCSTGPGARHDEQAAVVQEATAPAPGRSRCERRQTHTSMASPTSSRARSQPRPAPPPAAAVVVERPPAERPPEQRRCRSTRRRRRGAASCRSAGRAGACAPAGARPSTASRRPSAPG